MSPRGKGIAAAYSQSPPRVTGLPRGRDSRLVVPTPRPAPCTPAAFQLGVATWPEGQKEAQPAESFWKLPYRADFLLLPVLQTQM